MAEHPIEGLMVTAMNSIQDMVDVNTIIGEPIKTEKNTVIIPISKVCFGFAAGGSEFKGETVDEYSKKEEEEMIQYKLPFGGGSGAGVSINPVAFLVVKEDNVKLLPVNHSSSIDKLLDYVPELFDKLNETISSNKKEKSKSNIKEEKVRAEVEEIERNRKRRPRKPVQKTNRTYEFEYEDNKPETHVDEDVAEYIDDEKLDD